MAGAESSQWLFTDAEILSSPSILDGLDPAEERCRRAKGVNFILQVGMLLKIPQLTLSVASVFFHRFYMRRSLDVEHQPLQALHHYNIAATALFLATKTEENCRKTKEIVIAVAKVAQKNTSLIIDEQSKEYWRWRDSILLYEELMLELLTFDVVLQSPYKFLYRYLQQLQIETNKKVRDVAWSFINDSCMTTLCLRMSASDIAMGAVYFAVKFNNETIPDDEHGGAWWEQLNGDSDLIVKAVGIMNDFWHDNPLKIADKPYGSAEYASSQEDLENTRRRGDSDAASSVEAASEVLSQPDVSNGSMKRKSDEEGDDIEEPMPKKVRTAETPDVKVEATKTAEDVDRESQESGEANVEEGEVA